MSKTVHVLRHELVTTLSRRSFLLVSFGIPLAAVLIFAVISILRSDTSSSVDVSMSMEESTELEVEGYVDQAGLIDIIPEQIPSDYLLPYSNEEQAQKALEAGEIGAYYIIPEDYIEEGEFIYIHPTYSPTSSDGQEWMMRRTLLVNLLDGDAKLADKVWNPMDLKVTNLAPKPQYDRYAEEDCSTPGPACESSTLVQYIPFIMAILFYIFITMGSSLLIRNVSGEKENMVMEILMQSIHPRQLLTGKLIGLGIASLLPTIAWLGASYAILRLGGGVLNLPAELTIPPSLLVWGIVFFILGYAVYASLMAGAGALLPNMKEISQATWVVMMPLMAGYIVALMASGEAPHAALPIALSLFPLTAPIVMIMRLTIGGVPLWQPFLAAGLMALTAVLIVRSVANMFRAQTLLSGQPFSARRFYRALLGRV
ncbi:MAG: ABC transporter permease [Anaerolineaceae bacterium]|nr:MAG: ABC transporter permease [Anaerolineaceae bacterium]